MLVDLAEKHLGSEGDDTLAAVAQAYVDAGLFDAAGLTESNVQSTIDFFESAGVIDHLDAADVADLSLLP